MGEVRKQELSTFYKRTETEIETEAGFAWGIEERGCFEGVGGGGVLCADLYTCTRLQADRPGIAANGFARYL